MQRTHTCGELRATHVDQIVTLCGWVHNRRDHGGVIFLDLRDRYGLTQITLDPDICGKEAHELGNRVRSEWVLQITGKVTSRGDKKNANIATGDIEVFAKELVVLNKAETPPFEIDEHIKVGEEPENDVRRQVPMSELAGSPKQLSAVESVVRKLSQERLLTTWSPNEARGNSAKPTPPVILVELAHESLIRHWQRLSDWSGECKKGFFS